MQYRVKRAVGPYKDRTVGEVIDVPRHPVAENEGWLEPVSIIVDVDKPDPDAPRVKVRVLDVVQIVGQEK